LIEEQLIRADIPVQISYSAGTYVCNDVFYTLLDHFNESNTKVGFIHVPYIVEQCKEPCLELSQIVKGLTIAIESV
jgi:pyroglutamyl-peptidase